MGLQINPVSIIAYILIHPAVIDVTEHCRFAGHQHLFDPAHVVGEATAELPGVLLEHLDRVVDHARRLEEPAPAADRRKPVPHLVLPCYLASAPLNSEALDYPYGANTCC